MTDALVSFAWIAAAALLAPVLSSLTRRRIPAVVFLLVLGAVIGPFGLGLASESEAISLLHELGLGLLFLLAGMEINPSSLKSREGKHAAGTWLVSMLLCFGAAHLFTGGNTSMSIVIAIALTSTALGTLLPILKQNGLTGTPVGNSVMIHGAVGELAPVLAMAVLLSARSTWVTAAVLILFFLVAVVVALLPRTVRWMPRVGRALREGIGSTNQTAMRTFVLILAILMAVAAVFDLDVVLGAFAAGFILREIVPGDLLHDVEKELDVVGYGVFIPAFFVTSGMAIDSSVLVSQPVFILVLVLTILVFRGLPVFLSETLLRTGSSLNGWRQRLEMSLYSSTGLPIIVAVTSVATSADIISQEDASVFVAAGALTVLIFPLSAFLLQRKDPRPVAVDGK